MIITISGELGSGKSTVAKLLAEQLNLKHYSTGDLMRRIAKEKGITFQKLTELAENDVEVDKEIDLYTKKLAETEKDFVIDSRMAFHFIKNSLNIYMVIDEVVGAQRILLAKRNEEHYKNLDEAIDYLAKRKNSEIERYNKLYGINCHDLTKEHYDLIIDTTTLLPEMVVKEIIEFVENF